MVSHLINAILAILAVYLLSGCAFSIPVTERAELRIWINAELQSTEPLPAIWLPDK